MRTMTNRWSVLAAALLFAASSGFAASSSTYLQVTVRVIPNCQIAVTDLRFADYDPLVANSTNPLDGTADLAMRCSKNAQATVILDYGRNGSGNRRAMGHGSDRVVYDLFRDAARTERWTDGPNALNVVGVGGRDSQLFTVYGRVPAGQEVSPGGYADTIMATVDF